jgi:hypothetical protein
MQEDFSLWFVKRIMKRFGGSKFNRSSISCHLERRERSSFKGRFLLLVEMTESKPAGRVPPYALLFVQAATKSKQKMPIAGSGHVCMRVLGALI